MPELCLKKIPNQSENGYENRLNSRLQPLNKKDAINMIEILNGYIPLFPANIKDNKQDIFVQAWWECISMLYF